jgi:hypothetical protein
MRAGTRRFLISALIVLALSIGAAYYASRYLPDRYNPWTPLRLDEPPNFLTRVKLMRLRENGDMCLAVLANSELRYTRVPNAVKGPGCEFDNVVMIQGFPDVDVNRPFPLTCPTAVSLALWEQHVLQPAAEGIFSTPVVKIEHFGSYACRNIYHREKGPRSLHATAAAIDLAAFVFSDGTRIKISNDWKPDTPESLFLHEIRNGACPIFSAVLGPDYNAAHRDHFHFDLGPYRACR